MESNVKHTPGWSVRPGLANTIRDGAGSLVAELPSHWPLDDPRGLMMAAAPDLLAACREALRVQSLPFDHPDKRDLRKVLAAAISKADGGAS